MEDESDLNWIVAFTLKKHGYDVLTAASTQSAIASLQSKRPDLVVLDVYMPGGNGTEVCQFIRQNPELKDLPVIFFTAICAQDAAAKTQVFGANAYITKPYDSQKLLQTIASMLAGPSCASPSVEAELSPP